MVLNDMFSYDSGLLAANFNLSIAITAGEYVVSITLNQNYTIWDYRNMPFNIGGQVCLPFCLYGCFFVFDFYSIFRLGRMGNL